MNTPQFLERIAKTLKNPSTSLEDIQFSDVVVKPDKKSKKYAEETQETITVEDWKS